MERKEISRSFDNGKMTNILLLQNETYTIRMGFFLKLSNNEYAVREHKKNKQLYHTQQLAKMNAQQKKLKFIPLLIDSN